MVLANPDRVLAVLGDLRPMARVGPAPLTDVRDVLHERLTELRADPPARRFGRVFVGGPEQARGRRFAVVFVPGLAERVFPHRPRQDPLLLDDLRAAFNAAAAGPPRLGLPDRHDLNAREKLLLRLAVGAATERIHFSYPRLEVGKARPRVPSFYALDVERGAHRPHSGLPRGGAAGVPAGGGATGVARAAGSGPRHRRRGARPGRARRAVRAGTRQGRGRRAGTLPVSPQSGAAARAGRALGPVEARLVAPRRALRDRRRHEGNARRPPARCQALLAVCAAVLRGLPLQVPALVGAPAAPSGGGRAASGTPGSADPRPAVSRGAGGSGQDAGTPGGPARDPRARPRRGGGRRRGARSRGGRLCRAARPGDRARVAGRDRGAARRSEGLGAARRERGRRVDADARGARIRTAAGGWARSGERAGAGAGRRPLASARGRGPDRSQGETDGAGRAARDGSQDRPEPDAGGGWWSEAARRCSRFSTGWPWRGRWAGPCTNRGCRSAPRRAATSSASSRWTTARAAPGRRSWRLWIERSRPARCCRRPVRERADGATSRSCAGPGKNGARRPSTGRRPDRSPARALERRRLYWRT